MANLITENNAVGNIDVGLSSVSNSLVLKDISGFPVLNDPDDFCILTLIRESDNAIEYVKCTAQDIPSKTYTVDRAQEGTTSLVFADNDEVRNLLTRDQITFLLGRDDEKLPKDGSEAMTGDLNLGTNKVTQVADGVDNLDAVNLQQLNTAKVLYITSSGSNANGNYRVWSDGVKEQWGRLTTAVIGDNTITFPINFSGTAFRTQVTGRGTSGNNINTIIVRSNGTQNSFIARCTDTGSAIPNIDWYAISS